MGAYGRIQQLNVAERQELDDLRENNALHCQTR